MLNSEKQIYLVLIGHWYVNMGLGNMDNMGNCPLINSLPGQFSRRSYFGSKSSCKARISYLCCGLPLTIGNKYGQHLKPSNTKTH